MAKRRPKKRISDEALGELIEGAVQERLAHDRATGRVWFVDGAGALRHFDGFEIAQPGLILDGGAGWLIAAVQESGVASERLSLWPRNGSRYHDLVRYGQRVLWRWGRNNGRDMAQRELTADTEAGAAELLAILRANPPKGFREAPGGYVPGRGAVIRTYHRMRGPLGRPTLVGLLDRTIVNFNGGVVESFNTLSAAHEGFERWEAQRILDGEDVVEIEHSKHARRETDMTLTEVLQRRQRAAWKAPPQDALSARLAVIDELVAALERAGLRGHLPDLRLERAEPIESPSAVMLAPLWQACGAMTLHLGGGRLLRVLAPDEQAALRGPIQARWGGYQTFDGRPIRPVILDESGLPRLLHLVGAPTGEALMAFDGGRRSQPCGPLGVMVGNLFLEAAMAALRGCKPLRRVRYPG